MRNPWKRRDVKLRIMRISSSLPPMCEIYFIIASQTYKHIVTPHECDSKSIIWFRLVRFGLALGLENVSGLVCGLVYAVYGLVSNQTVNQTAKRLAGGFFAKPNQTENFGL